MEVKRFRTAALSGTNRIVRWISKYIDELMGIKGKIRYLKHNLPFAETELKRIVPCFEMENQ